MINYTPDEIRELVKEPPFRELPTERKCPACGNVSVRSYMYASERWPGNPTVISYTWCASCGRGSGSTGPRPDDLTFTDPLESLSKQERLKLEDGGGLFELLNRLWDEGKLPQTFGKAQ